MSKFYREKKKKKHKITKTILFPGIFRQQSIVFISQAIVFHTQVLERFFLLL